MFSIITFIQVKKMIRLEATNLSKNTSQGKPDDEYIGTDL